MHLDPPESGGQRQGQGCNAGGRIFLRQGQEGKANESSSGKDAYEYGRAKGYHDKAVVSGPTIELFGNRLSQSCIICPPKPTSPTSAARPSLGMKLPYLYLTVHVPQLLDFAFEVTILDDKNEVRRLRASTHHVDTTIKPDICTFPLKLERDRERLVRDPLLLPTRKEGVECDGAHSSDIGYYGPNGGVHEDREEEDVDCYDNKLLSAWNNVMLPLSQYITRAYGTTYVETISIQIHPNCILKRVYFADKDVNEDDELPEEFRLFHCPS